MEKTITFVNRKGNERKINKKQFNRLINKLIKISKAKKKMEIIEHSGDF